MMRGHAATVAPMPRRLVLAAAAIVALPMTLGTAAAQVSVDDGALKSLGPPAAATPPAASAAKASAKPGARRSTRHPSPRHPLPHPLAHGAPKIPAPVLHTAPPPTPQLAPIITVPHAALPVPPIPLAANAAGGTVPTAAGLQVTFGPDSADLNPNTVAAIRRFADGVKPDPNGSVALDAFAPGSPDDLSTPRRLSLSRGLAVRTVLLAAGLPSSRIFVRALGSTVTGGPADRVDIARNLPDGHLPAPPVLAPSPPP